MRKRNDLDIEERAEERLDLKAVSCAWGEPEGKGQSLSRVISKGRRGLQTWWKERHDRVVEVLEPV